MFLKIVLRNYLKTGISIDFGILILRGGYKYVKKIVLIYYLKTGISGFLPILIFQIIVE